MDLNFCPGAKHVRQLKPEIFSCQNCGEEVEIWSDEIKGVCNNCQKTIFRDQKLSCLEWCKFAQECVGIEDYNKYFQNKT